MVILLMQFLWKYIDDLIGKGLEFNIIIELLWYSSITLIPIALPLAVLLASMMLIGGLAEKSELTAINSLGQPFTYIMAPLFLFSIIIGITSFIISNYAIPYANLKATNLMYDIMHKKLNVNIKENVFFSDIDGYSIRIEKKENDKLMRNIIIYDYTSKTGIEKIFIAEKAEMSITKNNNYLLINLYNGQSYSDVLKDEKKYELNTKFNQYKLSLDLSSFKMERTSSDRFSNRAKTMNINQLKVSLDSLKKEKIKFTNKIAKKYTYSQIKKSENLYPTKNQSINQANIGIDQKLREFKNYKNQIHIITKKINKFEVELHKKLTLSIACIIMLIIGGPIGAIIKKGGLGLPVIFSIFLFLMYHIISITGEKMVKKDLINPMIGMWASTYVMLTIGILLIIIVNNNYLTTKIWQRK